jgi:hypothetical protein
MMKLFLKRKERYSRERNAEEENCLFPLSEMKFIFPSMYSSVG